MGKFVDFIKIGRAVIGGIPIVSEMAKPITGPIGVATTIYDIREGRKTNHRIDTLQNKFDSLQGNLNDYVKRDDPLIKTLENMVVGVSNSYEQFKEMQQDRYSILFPEIFGEKMGHILTNPKIGARRVSLENLTNDPEQLSFLITVNGHNFMYNVPIDRFSIAMEYLHLGKDKEELVGVPMEGSSLVIPKRELHLPDGKKVSVSSSRSIDNKVNGIPTNAHPQQKRISKNPYLSLHYRIVDNSYKKYMKMYKGKNLYPERNFLRPILEKNPDYESLPPHIKEEMINLKIFCRIPYLEEEKDVMQDQQEFYEKRLKGIYFRADKKLTRENINSNKDVIRILNEMYSTIRECYTQITH
jgi:hypothetical protein